MNDVQNRYIESNGVDTDNLISNGVTHDVSSANVNSVHAIHTHTDRSFDIETISTDAALDDDTDINTSITQSQVYAPTIHKYKEILCVILGTCIGVVVRLYVDESINTLVLTKTYPLATTLVNVIGCIIIGYVNYLFSFSTLSTVSAYYEYMTYLKLILVTGLCGSLTTWSQYVTDIYTVIKISGWSRIWIVVIYILVTNIICIGIVGIMCYLGTISRNWYINQKIQRTTPT